MALLNEPSFDISKGLLKNAGALLGCFNVVIPEVQAIREDDRPMD